MKSGDSNSGLANISGINARLEQIIDLVVELKSEVNNMKLQPKGIIDRIFFGKKKTTDLVETTTKTPVHENISEMNEVEAHQLTVIDERIPPIPVVLPNTPKVIRDSYRADKLESLRLQAINLSAPLAQKTYQDVVLFVETYVQGKTIPEVVELTGLSKWRCYKLRRLCFDQHTYGEQFQHTTPLTHRRGVARKKSRVEKKAPAMSLSELSQEIQSKPSVVPIRARSIPADFQKATRHIVPEPSTLYQNAITDRVCRFDPSSMWKAYDMLTTGNGGSVGEYNMHYNVLNLYLHGSDAQEISDRLKIDAESIIKSMVR